MKLNRCNCVITGVTGATGAVIREHLLDQGATVIGITRPSNDSNGLTRQGTNDFTLGLDVFDPDYIRNGIELIRKELHQIHVWINIVGGFEMGENVEVWPTSAWEKMWRLNFLSALHSTQAILPHFKEFNTGRLVHFGSAAVTSGMAKAGPYLVSKAAVHELTIATAAELRDSDITCNAILPGTINTKANQDAMPDADRSTWVTPQTIAEKIAGLITSSTNGELIIL